MLASSNTAANLSRAELCRWLPDFLAVVEAGCVRDAARALGKSAMSVARSIHRLEREVAARLFRRERGRFTLTPVGALLLSGVGERICELADGIALPPAPAVAPEANAMTWVDEEADRRRRARQGPIVLRTGSVAEASERAAAANSASKVERALLPISG